MTLLYKAERGLEGQRPNNRDKGNRGRAREEFFTAILLLGPIPNEWKRQFKLGCSNQGGMQSSLGSEVENRFHLASWLSLQVNQGKGWSWR